jgi:enoyl-CoA hydratase/carnithine racemase
LIAPEVHRIGLVNEVVPAADLISRGEAILKQISANAPLAIRYSIDAVNESGLKLEAKYFALLQALKTGRKALLPSSRSLSHSSSGSDGILQHFKPSSVHQHHCSG